MAIDLKKLPEVKDGQIKLLTLCCWQKVVFTDLDPLRVAKRDCECPNCHKMWEVTFLPLCDGPERLVMRENWRRKSKKK